MPAIDRTVLTYIRKKRAELLTTFSKWNPDKRVEGPRSQSNIPYTEMKLATGFASSDSAPPAPPPPPIENITLPDIATLGGGGWLLKNPNTIITSNQILTIFSKQLLIIASGETFTNNGSIISAGGIANSGTFSNYGTIDNTGSLYNAELSSGIIDNYGTITSNGSGFGIDIPAGTFTNHSVGIITNNDSSFLQLRSGTFTNNGVIGNVEGSFISVTGGTFTNNNIIYSPATDTGCGIGTITGFITGNPITNACPPAGPV